jgi:hypothetical protein
MIVYSQKKTLAQKKGWGITFFHAIGFVRNPKDIRHIWENFLCNKQQELTFPTTQFKQQWRSACTTL